MQNSEFAGEVAIELNAGSAQLRARISERVAANKVAAKTYRGFCLSLIKGGDGSTRCTRVALVDTPDIAKTTTGALLKIGKPIMPSLDILCHRNEVRLAVREARDRASEEQRLSKASNPPPGGYARPQGEAQHQGTSNTRGGRGNDKSGYGEGIGGDRCMAAIRQAMSQPFKEAGGLITMLGSRRA